MSILNDSRVKPFGVDGHEVTTDGDPVRVLPNKLMGWGLYTGDRLDVVFIDGAAAIGYESAEAAVEAVLS